MSSVGAAPPAPRCDYAAVGHVTVDVLADGSRRPGGSAFYGALQAARLGCRALIVTAGREREIEELLAPYRSELEVLVAPAAATTTLATTGSGADRRQRLLAWAGPIPRDLAFAATLLHLAPVARELPARWRRPAAFVGLTPQGLLRSWDAPGGEITLPAGERRRAAAALPACDALVLSDVELASWPGLEQAAAAQGTLVAVTAGPAPTRLLLAEGGTLELAVPAVREPVDDLGAGDVFAAAFFVALADGRDPAAAAALGNAAAAVRMRADGPGAIGRRAEIEARLRAAPAPGC